MERNISCIKLWSWGAALPPEKNVLGHLRAQVREECILSSWEEAVSIPQA